MSQDDEFRAELDAIDQDFLARLGVVIADARVDLGLSQSALAISCGLSRPYLSGIERGKRNMTVVVLLRICRSLKVGMDVLIARA